MIFILNYNLQSLIQPRFGRCTEYSIHATLLPFYRVTPHGNGPACCSHDTGIGQRSQIITRLQIFVGEEEETKAKTACTSALNAIQI